MAENSTAGTTINDASVVEEDFDGVDDDDDDEQEAVIKA